MAFILALHTILRPQSAPSGVCFAACDVAAAYILLTLLGHGWLNAGYHRISGQFGMGDADKYVQFCMYPDHGSWGIPILQKGIRL
jgi:hypothetical protein